MRSKKLDVTDDANCGVLSLLFLELGLDGLAFAGDDDDRASEDATGNDTSKHTKDAKDAGARLIVQIPFARLRCLQLVLKLLSNK